MEYEEVDEVKALICWAEWYKERRVQAHHVANWKLQMVCVCCESENDKRKAERKKYPLQSLIQNYTKSKNVQKDGNYIRSF